MIGRSCFGVDVKDLSNGEYSCSGEDGAEVEARGPDCGIDEEKHAVNFEAMMR